jgi:hypothetical protein
MIKDSDLMVEKKLIGILKQREILMIIIGDLIEAYDMRLLQKN